MKYWIAEKIEPHIKSFNESDSQSERDAIFEEHLLPPLKILVEYICNTFKQDYMNDTTQRVQEDALSFVVSKLHLFKPEKGAGKSFGYFSLVAKNYLIQKNNETFYHWKRIKSIDDDENKWCNDNIAIIADEPTIKNKEIEEMQEFVKLIIEYFTDEKLNDLFYQSTKNRLLMIGITKSYLRCFVKLYTTEKRHCRSAHKLSNHQICKENNIPYKPAWNNLIKKTKDRINPLLKKLYNQYIETGKIDMAKNANKKATLYNNNKLLPSQVMQIVAKLNNAKSNKISDSKNEICKEYGISRALINSILRGERWQTQTAMIS